MPWYHVLDKIIALSTIPDSTEKILLLVVEPEGLDAPEVRRELHRPGWAIKEVLKVLGVLVPVVHHADLVGIFLDHLLEE